MKIKLTTICLVIGTMLAPIAAHAGDTETDKDRTHPKTFVKDAAITTKIKAKLAAENIKSLAHIKVDTHSKGEVVLSGKVRTQEEADKVVSIVRETEGVTSVKSDLRVEKDDTDADRKHPKAFVKDSVITTKIKTKLAAENIKSLAHISVDTDSKGEVVLSGIVRSQEEADKAVSIARATEGVVSVESNLKVKKDD